MAEQKDAEQKTGFRGLFSKLKRAMRADANFGSDTAEPEEALAQPEEVEEEDAPRMLPVKDNALYGLYCRISGLPQPDDEAEFDAAVFHVDELAPNEETLALLNKLEREVARVVGAWENADTEPVDALPVVMVTDDRMRAYGFIFPPMFGGQDVTEETLAEAWKAQKVEYGVSGDVVRYVVEDEVYMRLFVLALGTDVQDGVDGCIVDHFARDNNIRLTVKWDNTIDYRDLGWLQTVNEGDVICDIIPPTDAVPGTNVLGKELKGKNGRKMTAPGGSGTGTNEDGTALVAKMNGILTFAAERFRVDPLLIVEGHVDIGVGNLDVIGDVLVKGDVQEGFTVKATGNITINGGVEGAQIAAGGNVQIGLGMNGNSIGSITAGNEVYSKFFENTTVRAGGTIVCDTIINSTIASEGEVLVKTGRGSIIGGHITALTRVAALSIGNHSNRNIEIFLGNTADFLNEKRGMEDERIKLAQDIEELGKNLNFLQRQTDTPVKKERMNDLNLQLKMRKMKMSLIERDFQQMLAREADIAKCRLQAEVLYPPAQIAVGNVVKMVRENHYNVLLYYKDGEIHIANV